MCIGTTLAKSEVATSTETPSFVLFHLCMDRETSFSPEPTSEQYDRYMLIVCICMQT